MAEEAKKTSPEQLCTWPRVRKQVTRILFMPLMGHRHLLAGTSSTTVDVHVPTLTSRPCLDQPSAAFHTCSQLITPTAPELHLATLHGTAINQQTSRLLQLRIQQQYGSISIAAGAATLPHITLEPHHHITQLLATAPAPPFRCGLPHHVNVSDAISDA